MRQAKFYLEDEYYQILKQRAEERGVSISSLVREIVLKELGVLEENSLEKRLEALERELEELKEHYNKMIKVIKKHGDMLKDLYNCCSQVNIMWSMSKRYKKR